MKEGEVEDAGFTLKLLADALTSVAQILGSWIPMPAIKNASGAAARMAATQPWEVVSMSIPEASQAEASTDKARKSP